MDIAQEICTDSFYTENSGLPRVPLTAVVPYMYKHIATLLKGSVIARTTDVTLPIVNCYKFQGFQVDFKWAWLDDFL